MLNPLKCVLLVDDDEATNFMNRRLLKKNKITEQIVVAENGQLALDYLTKSSINEKQEEVYPQPDLIILDINMPVMNGWEFMEAYETLPENQKAKVVIVMLTTSISTLDEERFAKTGQLKGYMSKPLQKDELLKVIKANFPQHFEDTKVNKDN